MSQEWLCESGPLKGTHLGGANREEAPARCLSRSDNPTDNLWNLIRFHGSCATYCVLHYPLFQQHGASIQLHFPQYTECSFRFLWENLERFHHYCIRHHYCYHLRQCPCAEDIWRNIRMGLVGLREDHNKSDFPMNVQISRKHQKTPCCEQLRAKRQSWYNKATDRSYFTSHKTLLLFLDKQWRWPAHPMWTSSTIEYCRQSALIRDLAL